MSGFADARVLQHHGVPTLQINGQAIHGMTATSCAFDDPAVIRDFVASGVEIMMIWIEAPLHCWKGHGKYDWSYAEKKLRHFEEHAGNTHWIIRVRLGLVAPWFGHTFPNEVHNPPMPGEQQDMSVCNIVSSVWLAHVKQVVSDFVTWLKSTHWASRIIGFMLNAGSTEEWLIFDTRDTTRGIYHPVYQREFRSWLRREYRDDVHALRGAWAGKEPTVKLDHQGRKEASAGIDFDTASCPTGHIRKGSHIWGPYSLRDPREDRAAIDYYRFLNETLSDYFITFCRTAKEAAGSPIICGGFHSYLWWESGVYSYVQEYGHGLIQKLNASPHVDFVSDITSYDCRYPGGPSNYLGLPHSLNLHGKLHYTEVDLCTISSLPASYRQAWAASDTTTVSVRSAEPVIPRRVWNWTLGHCGRDEQEQIALFQREHIHNLITGSPYWWFDIRSHNYQEPWMIEELRRLSDIGKHAIQWDRRSISDVAFICSEQTPFYQASMNGELLRFEMESAHSLLLDLCTRQWGVAGMPFDIYEIGDLAHEQFPGSQYKLLIFVNCARISENEALGVRRWQNGGRTLCWTYAANVYHGNRIAPEQGESILGMRLGWRNQRQNIHVQFGESDHALARGGAALNFGTEGSVGPVFFANDRDAHVLGHLRDGGEPAIAVRPHGDWNSVYLSMLNFGPEVFRNLGRFAGAHIWSNQNDVVYANRSMLCLHTASAGTKKVSLPAPAMVTDLWTGAGTERPIESISLNSAAYRTHAWRTQYIKE